MVEMVQQGKLALLCPWLESAVSTSSQVKPGTEVLPSVADAGAVGSCCTQANNCLVWSG